MMDRQHSRVGGRFLEILACLIAVLFASGASKWERGGSRGSVARGLHARACVLLGWGVRNAMSRSRLVGYLWWREGRKGFVIGAHPASGLLGSSGLYAKGRVGGGVRGLAPREMRPLPSSGTQCYGHPPTQSQ